jgi:hypothetical protein
MDEVNAILRRLDHDNIDVIRSDIASLIRRYLERVRESLGYWEKSHFAEAIADLAYNINAGHQPTTFWLRLSLFNLELAFVPSNQRNENYVPRDNQLDALTFEQLMEALDNVRFVR